MAKKVNKFHFIQDWGTYTNQTLVCVGMSHDEISELMKKKEYSNVAQKKWNDPEEKKEWVDITDDSLGACWCYEGKSLLWLPHWENNWGHIETLVHETAHLVHNTLGKSKNMMDEDEGRAYQQEYLFKSIRKKLGIFSNKGRKIKVKKLC